MKKYKKIIKIKKENIGKTKKGKEREREQEERSRRKRKRKKLKFCYSTYLVFFTSRFVITTRKADTCAKGINYSSPWLPLT